MYKCVRFAEIKNSIEPSYSGFTNCRKTPFGYVILRSDKTWVLLLHVWREPKSKTTHTPRAPRGPTLKSTCPRECRGTMKVVRGVARRSGETCPRTPDARNPSQSLLPSVITFAASRIIIRVSRSPDRNNYYYNAFRTRASRFSSPAGRYV